MPVADATVQTGTRRTKRPAPSLEEELQLATERNEFLVEYQPVVELRTGSVVGAEALVRWRHPIRGTVAPGDFLPIAEQTGLIERIGAFVLERACRQTRSWQ